MPPRVSLRSTRRFVFPEHDRCEMKKPKIPSPSPTPRAAGRSRPCWPWQPSPPPLHSPDTPSRKLGSAAGRRLWTPAATRVTRHTSARRSARFLPCLPTTDPPPESFSMASTATSSPPPSVLSVALGGGFTVEMWLSTDLGPDSNANLFGCRQRQQHHQPLGQPTLELIRR